MSNSANTTPEDATGTLPAQADVAARLGLHSTPLAIASFSANTIRSYATALRGLDTWLAGRPADDASIADYLNHLHARGRAPASAAMVAAAVRATAKANGTQPPIGKRTDDALRGFRRTAAGRGRGQAKGVSAGDVAAILATSGLPREFATKRGLRTESNASARMRGLEDAAIAALLFQGALRRSEVSTLRWQAVQDASEGQGVLIVVKTSKTNQNGEATDVRFMKNGCAVAVRRLKAARPTEDIDSNALVFRGLNAQSIGRRFANAAAAAGLEGRRTAHSGRVGLATELVRRGASTVDVMLAGGWKTSRMVARYASGATAEQGAVARYL